MAGRREKGKIAHGEWPGIGARYAAGERFASIARSYGCTAPAIRYIVGKHTLANDVRAADTAAAAAPDSRPPAPARSMMLSPLSPPRAIDQQLRERVNSDIATFLVAFDTAFENDTIV